MGLNIDSKDVWDLEIIRHTAFKIKDNFKLFLITVFFNLHVLQRKAKRRCVRYLPARFDSKCA